MKALQSPLARAILRDAYTTSKHIPMHNGALFTCADRECKKSFWKVICDMFTGGTNSKGPQ